MKVAAYIRVSSQSQVTDGDSLDGQRSSIESWAKSNGHQVVGWYIDEGVSAYSGVARKEFNRMFMDITTGELYIDAVVVYSLSRFSRKLLDQQQRVKILQDNNISLLSTSEPLPKDPNSNAMMLAFMGIVAEQNSRQTAKTVCDRLADTARNGYFTGGPTPFGYKSMVVQVGNKKKRKLVVDPVEAAIVKKIFNLSLRGTHGKPFGVKSIASYLNDNDYTKRGKDWTTQSLSHLLNNSTYCGEFIYRSKSGVNGMIEEIVVKVPNIITKNIFNKVKVGLESRELKNRNSKAIQSNSLLTGILTCGKCKSRLVVVSGKSGRYKYYACQSKINKSTSRCDSTYIRKDYLEKKVIEVFANKILTKEAIKKCKDKLTDIANEKYDDNKSAMSLLKKKKTKLEQGIKNFLDDILNGTIANSDIVNAYLKERQLEIDSINEKLSHLMKTQQIPLLKFSDELIDAFIKSSSELLLAGNHDAIKQLLLASIDKIVVCNAEKKIEIFTPTLALVRLVPMTKGGTDFSVPPFVSMWRRDRDLNPR
ncbi:recombinase family protein [Vibrio astriarenae]